MENDKPETPSINNISKEKQKNKEANMENTDSELDSPIILTPIIFTGESDENDSTKDNKKSLQDVPSIKDKKLYDQSSFIYDKYSKRIIYFDVPNKTILIYNRTKTRLIKKLQVFFNYKVLNACVDKKLTYLLIFANPNVNNPPGNVGIVHIYILEIGK